MHGPPALDLDPSLPVLICKMQGHPLHYGGLAIARSVGDCDVPVFALVEDHRAPLACSRFITGVLPAPPPDTPPAGILRLLEGAATLCGRPPLAVATDDEMAVFLNDHSPELADFLVLNRPPPGTAAALADKTRLPDIAAACAVNTPRSWWPLTSAGLRRQAADLRFPVVVKYAEPFTRLNAPGAAGPAVMPSQSALMSWADGVGDPLPPVVIQEYVPPEASQIWIYNGYRGGGQVVSFTGRTVRSWPPRRGAATLVVSEANPRVRELGDRLMHSVDFDGACDLDFVHDARDDTFRLLDFNPRYGASQAAFREDSGLDLIRANHLTLTQRVLPRGPQVDGRVLRVEPLDLRASRFFPPAQVRPRERVQAFWRPDDPRPAAAEWIRYLGGGALTAIRRRQTAPWGSGRSSGAR